MLRVSADELNQQRAVEGPLIEIAASCGCEVIGLAMGEVGMPKITAFVAKCEKAGVVLDHVYVDLV